MTLPHTLPPTDYLRMVAMVALWLSKAEILPPYSLPFETNTISNYYYKSGSGPRSGDLSQIASYHTSCHPPKQLDLQWLASRQSVSFFSSAPFYYSN